MLENLGLNQELTGELELLFRHSKKYDLKLTEKEFLETIFEEFLLPYRKRWIEQSFTKDNTILKNNLKRELQKSGASQTKMAEDIGINRSYLSDVVNEKYDPSLKIAFLILNYLGYAPKIKDIFYLEKLE